MIMALLILLFLLMIAIAGIIYVVAVHLALKDEFKEKDWMDNSEFDYGHNIQHNNDTDNF